MLSSQGIVPPRTFDTTSPRQYPSKNALMAPSARSNKACLNEISQPCRSLRGFRLGTASAPRLKMIRCVTICHYVSLRGKRNFRLTWQSRGSALIKFFTAYRLCILENVPPTCLHDKTNCNNHYPDRPPLTVKGLKFEISDIRLYEIDFVD